MSLNKREPISNREYIITFGKKHRGETIGQILEYDPNYLVYLHNVSDWFELDWQLLDEAENSTTQSG